MCCPSHVDLDAMRARGRHGDWLPALKARNLGEARALLRDPENTIEEVAVRLKVSPSVLYRYLAGGRSAVTATLLTSVPALLTCRTACMATRHTLLTKVVCWITHPQSSV